MLKVTRRHQPPCKRKMYDQGYTKCHCPVLIRGTLAGKRITLSAARFLRPPADRDLAAATRLARQWEADGEVRAALWEQPPEDPLPAAPAPAATSRTLIWYAISGWLRSRRARDIKPVSLRKFQTFARQLYAFTTARGYFYLDQITPEDMDQFYIEWKDGKAAKGNKLGRMRNFFRWAVKRKYISDNPAQDLEAPVGYTLPNQKTPLSDSMLERVYEAAANWKDQPWCYGGASGVITAERISTLLQLMVECGFAITDAATFHMDRIDPETGECTIRRTKTGAKVNTWLAPDLRERLARLALMHGPQPFVVASRDPKQLSDGWRERLNKVFRAAGPFPFRVTTHILRHTFIRVHLTRGTDINVIAELAGDTPDIIRKHYAEWVPERQNRLTKILKESYYARLEAQAGRGRVVNIRKAQ